jgi:hypothetical protein
MNMTLFIPTLLLLLSMSGCGSAGSASNNPLSQDTTGVDTTLSSDNENVNSAHLQSGLPAIPSIPNE